MRWRRSSLRSRNLGAWVRALVCGTSVLLLSWTAPAYAQEDTLDIVWSAPAGCPSKDQLIDRVRAITGTAALGDPRLQVEIVVQRGVTSEFSALLHTDIGGVEGTRELSGASCEEVTDAAALVLALLLKPPEATALAPAPEATVMPTPEERAPTPLAPVERAEPAPRRKDAAPVVSEWTLRALVRAGAGAGIGSLPGVAGIAVLHAGVSAGWAALEVRAGYGLPKSANVAGSPGIGGRFSVIEGGTLVCVRPSLFDWRFDSCAGLALSKMAGQGQGATETSGGSAVIGAALLEQAVARRLWENLALRLSVEAQAPVARPRFSIEGAGEIHRPAALAWRAILSAEVQF
jgi:hypothetical protein